MEPLVDMQIITKEISLKNNALPDGEFVINPTFTRNVGQMEDGRSFTELSVDFENTDTHPFPLDIHVTIVGIFTMDNIKENDRDRFLRINAVQILFPYLRNIITNVTANSFLPPIVLPVIDVLTLFEEDK